MRCLVRSGALALTVLAVLALPAAADAQGASDASPQPGREAGVFRMGDTPSLRFGDRLRVDVRGGVQTDINLGDASPEPVEGFTWGNRRIGIDGVLFDRLRFQVEREIGANNAWRDVFAELRAHDALRVRAGHFKVPFSMERTTSAFDLDFVARPAAVTGIAPGRETGVMVHGRGLRRLLEYEAGLFRANNAAVSPLVEGASSGVTLAAARVTVAPGAASVGLAFTESGLPEGSHGLSRYFSDDSALPSADTFYVHGRRRRLGIEGRWAARRLTIKGELLRQTDSRNGESVTGGDLSDLVVDGAYVSALWRVAGSSKKSGRAVDATVRFDRVSFHSAGISDDPSLSPRADHIAPLRQDALTVGVNWRVHRWVKLQVNGVRESLTDDAGVLPGIPPARWRSTMRLQFAM